MAQERPVTPEKQLLGLIETSHASAANVMTHAAKHHGMSFLSLRAWMGRASFLRDNLKKRFKGGEREFLSIKSLNNILAVLIILLALYAAFGIYNSVAHLKRIAAPKIAEQQSMEEPSGAQNASILKNAVSYYVEKVKERDIFKMGVAPTPEAPSGRKAAPTQKIVEETSRLKLVGISWSKDPDAMIEDTAALRTFFVKRGQMVGRVKIEAIFKDKVVLSFEGEEAELR